MKKRTLILLIFACLSFSAQIDKTIQSGQYSYIKLSNIQMGWLSVTKGIHHFFVGSDLLLNSDSTFIYRTCGSISTGNWYSKKDSLYLISKTIRWRSDSLNKYGYQGKWLSLPKKPIVFEIKSNYLEQILHLDNGDKGIERLKLNLP